VEIFIMRRSMTSRVVLCLAALMLCSGLLNRTTIRAEEERQAVKVLIITGDHGHAWKETTPVLQEILAKAGHEVDVTESPRLDLTADKLSKYSVLLFNYRDTPKGAAENPNSVWTDENKKAFIEAIQQGAGLVVYHHASSAFRGSSGFEAEFEMLSAGGWRSQGFHGKMHEFTVSTREEHPITKGIDSFLHGRDELYQNSLLTPGSQVLVTAYSDPEIDPKNTGKHEAMVWINKYGKGRVVQNALGHDVTAMQSPGFALLLTRCVEWAATGKTFTAVPSGSLDRPPQP
jgi:uncharacterized protein